ncbi:HTH-type transcriptional regulator BhcR [Roseovarius pelagicus]|uniref:IclR family transcriptional regulator n=1 Tax=Roseovarius pelagicus TaxID=2980108 RepID=A0ABY6DAC0_9RHOB|nr:HTH-type transcriptional regulator BhcR [Roseovarius pelagicus]UXX83048.1 IclR family transcriptional regulator [Roseovarius pelagicus]
MTAHENADAGRRRARGRPRDWHDKTAQNTNKTLERAMRVLEFLSEAQGKTLTALANDLDEAPATVYRILVTYEGLGVVQCDMSDQTWYIGPRAFIIGSRYLRRTSLVDRARPILRALMEQTGETANLGIEQNGHVLFVSQVETYASIRAFFPPGTLTPMHASGIGKALLAEMDDRRLEKFLNNAPLERFTDYTLADPDALTKDLRAIRARNYAVDDQERNVGMRCVAAPVFDFYNEAIAGISVSGPTSRIGIEQVTALGQAVVDAADDLTEAMGGGD